MHPYLLQNYYPILSVPLNTLKFNQVHALWVKGKMYLHDVGDFALDICCDLYLQPFDCMIQAEGSNDLFSAFAKTSN